MQNIHHLPFELPSDTSAINLAHIPSIIQNFYEERKTHSASTLAFKGGQQEKRLSEMLRIPRINLEDLGCPKAEHLFAESGWLETCGRHLPLKDNYKHCPKVETEAFGMWLQRQSFIHCWTYFILLSIFYVYFILILSWISREIFSTINSKSKTKQLMPRKIYKQWNKQWKQGKI